MTLPIPPSLDGARWRAAERPQTAECVLSGFYAVGPADAPSVAYVFGREEALLIAAGPRLLAALAALEPYLDAIVCYASTMDEHEPNRLAVDAREAVGAALGKPV